MKTQKNKKKKAGHRSWNKPRKAKWEKKTRGKALIGKPATMHKRTRKTNDGKNDHWKGTASTICERGKKQKTRRENKRVLKHRFPKSSHSPDKKGKVILSAWVLWNGDMKRVRMLETTFKKGGEEKKEREREKIFALQWVIANYKTEWRSTSALTCGGCVCKSTGIRTSAKAEGKAPESQKWKKRTKERNTVLKAYRGKAG